MQTKINYTNSTINSLLNSSNMITNNSIFSLTADKNKIINNIEREMLYFQVKDYIHQFLFQLKKLSVNINTDWIYGLTIENSVSYFYDILVLCIDTSIIVINDILNVNTVYMKFNEFMKHKLINTLIIYGASVYYLEKLMNLPILIKTQFCDKVDKVKKIINEDYKYKFYTVIENVIDEIIFYYEINDMQNEYILLFLNNKYSILSLLKDCCENLELLNFNLFLIGSN